MTSSAFDTIDSLYRDNPVPVTATVRAGFSKILITLRHALTGENMGEFRMGIATVAPGFKKRLTGRPGNRLTLLRLLGGMRRALSTKEIEAETGIAPRNQGKILAHPWFAVVEGDEGKVKNRRYTLSPMGRDAYDREVRR